jgi:hypothetical protein
MSVQNLDHIFNPKRIALVGVTQNPNSVGGKMLANLVGGGFSGVVYPVNPIQEAVPGIQCYPDVARLPRTPDLAIICSTGWQSTRPTRHSPLSMRAFRWKPKPCANKSARSSPSPPSSAPTSASARSGLPVSQGNSVSLKSLPTSEPVQSKE